MGIQGTPPGAGLAQVVLLLALAGPLEPLISFVAEDRGHARLPETQWPRSGPETSTPPLNLAFRSAFMQAFCKLRSEGERDGSNFHHHNIVVGPIDH